jgi:glutamate dehydrogenase (NADP+)
MGGGKGGSDFDPKGKSDNEVMRFCQSFMTELSRHIGPNTDVPAGDIGVGGREIGFLFGQYKKIRNEFTGVLTGKGINWGGSLIRPEATGYGAVYFAAEMLKTRGETLEGKTCLVSGSGNVAQYTTEKLNDLGGKASPSPTPAASSTIPRASTPRSWSGSWSSRTSSAAASGVRREVPLRHLHPGDPNDDHNPLWNVKADCAFPSATQNEINAKDAENLVNNGVYVSPKARTCRPPDGVEVFLEHKILYGPGKAANAGGVAVSGLEMSAEQHAPRLEPRGGRRPPEAAS